MDNILEFFTSTPIHVLVGQTLGIVGMMLAMISFQCKKNSVFCTLQALSGLSFTLHFFILGSVVQGALNMFNILRGLAFGFAPEKFRKFFALLLFVLYTGAAVVTYSPSDALWLTVVILAAQLFGTVTMCVGNAKVIRIVQLFYISPAWMLSNIITFSIGGILCETFNIISSAVALFRFRKEWFGKKRA